MLDYYTIITTHTESFKVAKEVRIAHLWSLPAAGFSAKSLVSSSEPLLNHLNFPSSSKSLAPTQYRPLELVLASAPPGDHPAPVERVLRIDVHAFDWNCPKFITPRFPADQVEAALEAMRTRVSELEAELARRG